MMPFLPPGNYGVDNPNRDLILTRLARIWHDYSLDIRTKFDTVIQTVSEEWGQWQINGGLMGGFNGVIVALGVCGEPRVPPLQKLQTFQGHVYHANELVR
jgi:cation diffusion facilitator CzcD-associated flavoprotein CzcO